MFSQHKRQHKRAQKKSGTFPNWNFVYPCATTINNHYTTKATDNLKGAPIETFFFQAYHFQKDDVALPGLHKYFKACSDEERGHAEKLMEYINKRGGHIILTDVGAPEKQDWGTAQEGMCAALELEKKVNEVNCNKW